MVCVCKTRASDSCRSHAEVGSPSPRMAFWFSELLFSLNKGGQTLHTSACSCQRCPLPALIFQTALSFPGSWASHCVRLCNFLGVPHPNVCCIGPLSSAHCVQAWFQTHAAPLLNRFLRDRLVAGASLLSVCRVRVSSLAVNAGPHQNGYGRSSIPSHARSWGLACWGHDPFPGGRAAKHLGLSLCRAFCVRPPLLTCSTVCLSAPPSRTFKTSGAVSVPSTQIPSLSGLATLGSSFPAPLFHLCQLDPRLCLVCWAGL